MSFLGQRSSSFSTAEEIVTSRARREPQCPALGWNDRMMLLGRFADIVAVRAETIAGIARPGAVVAQVMSDTPGFVSTTFAIWRAGCTAVPLDPRLAPQEIARRIEHSGARFVVAHEEHVERVEEALAAGGGDALLLVSRGIRLLPTGRARGAARARAGARRLVALPGRAAGRGRRDRAAASGRGGGVNDVAFLAYASDPGAPLRAAILTHANVVASALRLGSARGDAPDDVALASHPTCDVAALVAEVLSRLIAGGAVALLGPRGRGALIERIEQHRVTDVSLSSDLAVALADERLLPRRSVRSVRKVLLRDARLSLTVKRKLTDLFPAAELVQTHGAMETTDGILTARHGAVFRKPDTLGVPHPGLVLAILDPAGRALRPGERGEIACRGAVVLRGYHRSPQATRAVLRDGWLHTGDLGYIDSDGELSLIGRLRPAPGAGGEGHDHPRRERAHERTR